MPIYTAEQIRAKFPTYIKTLNIGTYCMQECKIGYLPGQEPDPAEILSGEFRFSQGNEESRLYTGAISISLPTVKIPYTFDLGQDGLLIHFPALNKRTHYESDWVKHVKITEQGFTPKEEIWLSRQKATIGDYGYSVLNVVESVDASLDEALSYRFYYQCEGYTGQSIINLEEEHTNDMYLCFNRNAVKYAINQVASAYKPRREDRKKFKEQAVNNMMGQAEQHQIKGFD